MSKTVSIHHIIINTRCRHMTITHENRKALYHLIYDIIERRKCHTIWINGIENHVHILLDLHPSVACADLVMEIKRETSRWMKQSRLFPNFEGWGKEYAAFSYSKAEKETVMNYVKNQQEHHKTQSYEDELRQFYEEYGFKFSVEYDLT